MILEESLVGSPLVQIVWQRLQQQEQRQQKRQRSSSSSKERQQQKQPHQKKAAAAAAAAAKKGSCNNSIAAVTAEVETAENAKRTRYPRTVYFTAVRIKASDTSRVGAGSWKSAKSATE